MPVTTTEFHILKKLANMDPSTELDGDPYCFFCEAYFDAKEEHESDCLWKVAKTVSEGKPYYTDNSTGVRYWRNT